MAQQTLGERVRFHRQQNGLGQGALAERLGVPQGTVYDWEHGNALPDAGQIAVLESVLGSGIADPTPENEILTQAGPSTVGAWLSNARQAKGLTVPELARRANTSAMAIYNIESGRAQSPQGKTIRKLESALGQQFGSAAEEDLKEANEIHGLGAFADFEPHDPEDWPNEAGVYVLYDVSQRPIYVGQARSIAARIKSHQEKFWFRAPIVQFASYVPVKDVQLRDQIERILIKFLKANAVLNRQQTESFSE